MKARNNYLLILSLTVLFSLCAATVEAKSVDIANPGKITGRINHENTNLPLEFVNVVLYSTPDSTLFAGTLTNQSGEFTFSMLDSGRYYIELTLPGYENRQLGPLSVSANGNKINLGEISLSPAIQGYTASRAEREKHSKNRKEKTAKSEIPKFAIESETILVDNSLKAAERIRK
jgi:hypothetical protein